MNPIWRDDIEMDALLHGLTSSGDDAFDEVLAQLRAAGKLGAPDPRADVEALIRTGWANQRRRARRWRLITATVLVSVLVSGTATAAASETVRDPLMDTIVKVVALVSHQHPDGSHSGHLVGPGTPRHTPKAASPHTGGPTTGSSRSPGSLLQPPTTQHSDDGQGDRRGDGHRHGQARQHGRAHQAGDVWQRDSTRDVNQQGDHQADARHEDNGHQSDGQGEDAGQQNQGHRQDDSRQDGRHDDGRHDDSQLRHSRPHGSQQHSSQQHSSQQHSSRRHSSRRHSSQQDNGDGAARQGDNGRVGQQDDDDGQ